MDHMTELEKIDLIRERTGAGYGEAKALLDEAGGDVVQALVCAESRQKERQRVDGAFEGTAKEVFEKAKQLLKKGNVTRIRVKKDDDILMEIPVTAGVVGTLLAPELAVLGAIACVAGRCTVEFEKRGEAERT